MPIARLALLACTLATVPAALAALDNYTIDLRRDTNLDIAATTTAGPVAAVQLTNRTPSRVRCFVDFEGGNLTPARRETWLEPGTVASVRQSINDPDIATLAVGLTCDTLSADEPIPAPNGTGQLIVRGTPQGTTGLPATQPVQPLPPFSPVPRPVTKVTPGTGTTTIISPGGNTATITDLGTRK